MTAQPSFDFTPPEDNLSLEGLEDFLSETKSEKPQSNSSETGYILHLLDRIMQVYELLDVTSDRLKYAQERLQSLELVMRIQAEQVAVLPYYQSRVLELERESIQIKESLHRHGQRVALIPFYQGRVVELEAEVRQIRAENERLNNHWLRRLFFWIR